MEGDAEPEMKADFSDASEQAVNEWNAIKEMSSFADLNSMGSHLNLAGAASMWAIYSAM